MALTVAESGGMPPVAVVRWKDDRHRRAACGTAKRREAQPRAPRRGGARGVRRARARGLARGDRPSGRARDRDPLPALLEPRGARRGDLRGADRRARRTRPGGGVRAGCVARGRARTRRNARAPGGRSRAQGRADALPTRRGQACERTRGVAGRVRAHARARPGVLQGTLRSDFALSDLALALWSFGPLLDATAEVAPKAWRRHLHWLLDGLRVTAATAQSEPPLTDEQLHARRCRP